MLPAQTATTSPLVKVDSRPLGTGNVQSGLDVLKADNFKKLHGKKVGLLTNIGAIDREGNHILDLILAEKDIDVVTLFSPEHGFYGDLDTHVSDVKDTATGLMIYSLYGAQKDPDTPRFHPRQEHLKGLDVVVVDLPDIGARYYTYISYMGKMMESCAKAGVAVMVLDRPNPIGGIYVDGPQQDPDMVGAITSYFPMPIAHGMTIGELAQMFNGEMKINSKLEVEKVKNWKRSQYLDETGLRWVNPSPNIQTLDGAIGYPGVAITEAIMSMGRGTTEPFHIFGSPLIEDPADMIKEVTSHTLEGVKLEVADFVPTGTLARYHHGEGKLCRGARIIITDRTKYRPFKLGLAVIDYMQRTYGKKMVNGNPAYPITRIRGALSSWVVLRTMDGRPLADTLAEVDKEVKTFLPVRDKYLIYRDL